MALPWDVFATPIAACKLARLGVEDGEVTLRPAFYRQLGASYGTVAHAVCPLHDHPAPQADCTCGFYAVADEGQLWRLGADEPELAVVDVELAGRVIEHDHGYRASDQRVRAVRVHGVCVRCGRRAELFGQRRFGGLVPACRRHARTPARRRAIAEALRVPVEFSTNEPVAIPVATRFEYVLAQLLVPILILLVTATVAVASNFGNPTRLGQLAIVVWLVTVPSMLGRLGDRLGIVGTEAIRLQHRWTPVVAAVAIGCDVVLTVVVIAARNVIAYRGAGHGSSLRRRRSVRDHHPRSTRRAQRS